MVRVLRFQAGCRAGGTVCLGLFITYRTVQRHNGNIEVSSEVGKGTTFRILLRSLQGEGADEQ